MYRPMTRPRTCGSADSWIRELIDVVNIISAAPHGTSITPNDEYVGISPSAPSSAPNARAEPSTSRSRGRPLPLRRAARMAPLSVPTARNVDINP